MSVNNRILDSTDELGIRNIIYVSFDLWHVSCLDFEIKTKNWIKGSAFCPNSKSIAFMISKINYDYPTYYFADESALFFLLHAYLKSYDCFWLLKSIKWEFVDHRKIFHNASKERKMM